MLRPINKNIAWCGKWIASNTQLLYHILNHWNSSLTDSQKNEWRPILKDGEEYCNHCDGTGYEPNQDYTNEWLLLCEKCAGAGKVDWVTNVMGADI